MFAQEREEFVFRVTGESVVLALVDDGLDVGVFFADLQDLLDLGDGEVADSRIWKICSGGRCR